MRPPPQRPFLTKEVRCKIMDKIIFAIIGIVVGVAVGFVVGMIYRKKVAEREIGSAELEATRLINEAIRSGESRNTTRKSRSAAPR